MAASNPYIQKLLAVNPLREELIAESIQTLPLRPGSRILDVGCGIGLHLEKLAEAAGPGGSATGLDQSSSLLQYAREELAGSSLADQIEFQIGSASELPYHESSFDWIWSVDCVGYPVWDLSQGLGNLYRIIRPGGGLAILGWSGQCFLPGYEMLEARLNATNSALAPFWAESDSDSHFLRGLKLFRSTGFETTRVQTFVGQVQGPLSEPVRQALIAMFEMLWGEKQAGVSSADWDQYQRLCTAESPELIIDSPDYIGFFTYTMFSGRVPDPHP